MKRAKSNAELQEELEDLYSDLETLRWEIEDKLDEINDMKDSVKGLQYELGELAEQEIEFVNDTYIDNPKQLKLFI